MQLTTNFFLEEFTHSDTAESLKIDNVPDSEETLRLLNLCTHVLETLRFSFATPIKIDSGFRCEKLNQAVGGVPDSQHRLGEASDIVIEGYEPEQIIHRLIELKLDFDEAIAEHDVTQGTHWTHVSYTTRKPNRRLPSRAIRENGRTVYYPWDKR